MTEAGATIRRASAPSRRALAPRPDVARAVYAAVTMATVLFFDELSRPDHAPQRDALAEAGHEVLVRDLLSHPWSPEELYAFLRGYPVVEWFDSSAPAITSGQLAPERLDAGSALRILLARPQLIRRPLLQIGARRVLGFVPEQLDAVIGLRGRSGELLDGSA